MRAHRKWTWHSCCSAFGQDGYQSTGLETLEPARIIPPTIFIAESLLGSFCTDGLRRWQSNYGGVVGELCLWISECLVANWWKCYTLGGICSWAAPPSQMELAGSYLLNVTRTQADVLHRVFLVGTWCTRVSRLDIWPMRDYCAY